MHNNIQYNNIYICVYVYINQYLPCLLYHHSAGVVGQSVCGRRCCLSMPQYLTPAQLKTPSQQSALVNPAKQQLCLFPEPCPAEYLTVLRWLWALPGSPAALGSGRSFTVITSQVTQHWPGKGWLLPSALILMFHQGRIHLCGINEEALLGDEKWQNWIFWVFAQF